MKVKVYTTPTCPWCARLKDFLKENNIEFEEINLAEDHDAAKEMVEKSGQMGVPATEIDSQMIIGFDKPALEKALKLKS